MERMGYVIVHEPLIATGPIGFSANAVMTEERMETMISESRAEAYAKGLAAGMRGSCTGRFGEQGAPPGRGRASGSTRSYYYLHGFDGNTSPRCYEMNAYHATFKAAMQAATFHASPVERGGETI